MLPTTAGIHPEKFADDLFFARSRPIAAVILAVFLIIGFALRVNQLGTESFGEDELNKLQTAQDYRTNGLSGKNGEHPFLMKGMQTISLSSAEKVNTFISSPGSKISEEAALRFPVALFGTFTALLIFLFVSELFGRSIGLISGVLWAVEPMAVGFDRLAKEDSLVLFFFLLTSLFWIRGQTLAERGTQHWLGYAWATAAGFAALMASKYYPHLLAVIGGYYNTFANIPGKKWSLGKINWLKFIVIMGLTFLILNPTIVFPDTWREMLKFSTENRIGHDSYEFMSGLYPNKMSAWLAGVPWTFYYVFIGVKTSLPTLVLFLIGLPLLFRRRMGDGRFFIFFWTFLWFMPFTFLGGKFVRYFTIVEPLVFIAAATAFYYSVRSLTGRFSAGSRLIPLVQAVFLVAFLAAPLLNSLYAAPHFRLFTNSIGGGTVAGGSYFPHDEFYDAATRDIVAGLTERAGSDAAVACETPALFEYYAERAGRPDLNFVSLSDRSKVAGLRAGDFVVIARGRRYFSNAAYIDYLEGNAPTAKEVDLLGIPAAKIYQMREEDLIGIRSIANRN